MEKFWKAPTGIVLEEPPLWQARINHLLSKDENYCVCTFSFRGFERHPLRQSIFKTYNRESMGSPFLQRNHEFAVNFAIDSKGESAGCHQLFDPVAETHRKR